jgi:adenylate cyclase
MATPVEDTSKDDTHPPDTPEETAAARLEADGAQHVDTTPVVLVVDDEPGILSSLQRLLRTTDYRVLCAENGAAALDLLATNDVDLIISDMRMPNMSGAEFLAHAQMLYPDVLRILLTGYAEMDSAIRAINEGGVYRYLSKPWDDQDLLLTVARAIEQRALSKKAALLTALTRQQNEALMRLNAGLEMQVQARTEEIRQTVMFLEDAQRDLKSNFTKMVQVCASMIELRCGALGGQSMRVGELAHRMALACGLSEFQALDVLHAGLLHGIGKLSLPDELLHKSLDRFTPEELQLYYQHPLRAQMVLTPVTQLEHVAHIVRHQYEQFNGRGTPDRLAGDEIPLGSRIVALARDFEGLLDGELMKQPVTAERAIEMLTLQAGMRYDPSLMEHFIAAVKERRAQASVLQVHAAQLREGMRFADDLRTSRGVLLMPKDSVVNAHQVAQIKRFEAHEPVPFTILVHAAPEA